MNREIKFRGISVDTGEWVYGSMVRGVGELVDRVYIVPAIITGYYSVYSMMDCIEVDPSTVGQYTGVKDMHWVEIYEGDIVKAHKFTQELGESLGVIEGETEFIAKINFSPYVGTRLETKDGYELFLWECEEGWHEESLEVIGNIHQHPELLNS